MRLPSSALTGLPLGIGGRCHNAAAGQAALLRLKLAGTNALLWPCRVRNCTCATRVGDGSTKAASLRVLRTRVHNNSLSGFQTHPETSKMMICNQQPLHYCTTVVLVRLQAVSIGQPVAVAALQVTSGSMPGGRDKTRVSASMAAING